MSQLRIVFLCEPCAEGRGLEVDGARIITATCADCGKRARCVVAKRPA